MNTQEKELKHCTACNQMTNHSGETCLKHTSDIEWTDTELYIDLAPEVSHRITAREGVLTNRLQMKAGEIVGLKELLSSRDTYWKERVLAILEDVLDREYQKRNPPKKHNYLESFMWDIHKAFMKDITNEDNLK